MPAELCLPARARLTELARAHDLDDVQAARLGVLLNIIATDPLAPTTVRDPAAAIDQHIADSLVALKLPAVRGARTAADLGAGAGLPGLALAAALPECRWLARRERQRKVAFIERAIAAMGLGNAHAVNARAEEWREGRRACDLVTARAVASPPVVLEYAAPCFASAARSSTGAREWHPTNSRPRPGRAGCSALNATSRTRSPHSPERIRATCMCT